MLGVIISLLCSFDHDDWPLGHVGEKKDPQRFFFFECGPSIIINDRTTTLAHPYCGPAGSGKVAAKPTAMPIFARTSDRTPSRKKKSISVLTDFDDKLQSRVNINLKTISRTPRLSEGKIRWFLF